MAVGILLVTTLCISRWPRQETTAYLLVSVSRGDVYSTMADRWYCAWVDEYLQATDASDTAREKRALDYLTGFTDDKLVAQFATNVPIYQESVLTPLEQSDVEPARSSVKTCEVFTGK